MNYLYLLRFKFTMLRRKIWKYYFGLRSSRLFFTLTAWVLLLCISWRLSRIISGFLLPPPPPDQDLSHFRRSRSLRDYLDNIQVLIEPSSLPCSEVEEVEVVVLVASAPTRLNYRHAVRQTWGRHLPVYFILGLDGLQSDDQLIENYVEAKQYGDMVVYDFKDHYQNLTLKTGLMLQWTLDRCPIAQFLFKTDDDVMVNPWVLKDVLKARADAKLLGYVYNDSIVHRDEHNKWYLPRWLCSEDVIPQYITGPGYLISGDYIRNILKAAKDVPLHNIEDIFYTYNVAKKSLGYGLTHDDRLSPKRPWLPLSCAHWSYATTHSLTPEDMISIWSQISRIGDIYSKGNEVCVFYENYLKYFVEFFN